VIVPTISPPGNVRTVLAEELDDLRSIVAGLSAAELVRATGCQGWMVADLLVHIRLGAEDLLHGLAAPCEDPADRDYISCWKDWPARSEVTFSDVRLTWAMAAWYTTADGLRRHFDDIVAIAARASRAARVGHVRLHGHVQSTEDFLAMWAVELCVHHLDLLVGVPDRLGPRPGAVEIALNTVDGLLEERQRPARWDELTYLLKATGRAPLDDADRDYLGAVAARYPVFG
jgi:hypothetical protein